ncbi:MAG: hypothetical protein Q8O40_17935, partial [Chloroflexota bacterium]|nr:hypothetical protein [Chloroflexota bacterium]
RVLFHLGCRVSEALALEVKDVALDPDSVTILHLKERIHLMSPRCGARFLAWTVNPERERKRRRAGPGSSP